MSLGAAEDAIDIMQVEYFVHTATNYYESK